MPDAATVPMPLPWQEDLHHDLHAHPELSMHETRTAGIIADRLESFGYAVQRIGGGVVGVLANGDGPTVLTRADMDGLPVTEATGLDYASTDTAVDEDGNTVGLMHACGHDVHVTCGLGAAAALAGNRDAWHGTHVALFQPAEETAAGARAMVADGLVDRVPRPDVCLAQHVLALPAGTVSTADGPVLSAADSIRVTVHGVGSHGSMPHLGVDPVVLAASIVVRLQGIVSRVLAPGEFGVVTVGSLQAGSTANIIGDRATMLLNVRAYDEGVRRRILDGIERIVRAECEASGCPTPPDIEYYDRYPLTTNDPATTGRVTSALVHALGAEAVHHLAPQTASEDFSIVPDAFGSPYCYWGLGGFTPDQEVVGNHNPRFAPAIQPTLETGTRAMVAAALAWLGDR